MSTHSTCAHLPCELFCLLSELFLRVENIHVHETMRVAEHVRDEGVFRLVVDIKVSVLSKSVVRKNSMTRSFLASYTDAALQG